MQNRSSSLSHFISSLSLSVCQSPPFLSLSSLSPPSPNSHLSSFFSFSGRLSYFFFPPIRISIHTSNGSDFNDEVASANEPGGGLIKVQGIDRDLIKNDTCLIFPLFNEIHGSESVTEFNFHFLTILILSILYQF